MLDPKASGLRVLQANTHDLLVLVDTFATRCDVVLTDSWEK